MQNNKVLLSFDMNGNFLSIQEDSNKIYAGSVASIEYYVDFSENLSVNDLVYISFTRPDNQKIPPLICQRILDNRFKLLSTGAELDYELTTTEEMTINVIIKSKDIVTNVSSIKTQASITVNVYPGSQFIPGLVDDSILSNLEEHLNEIEKYTIKKYDIKDIQNGEVLVPYVEDGMKEAPAVYVGYTHQVKTFNWELGEYVINTITGNLFVFKEIVDDKNTKQYEYLYSENDIYARTISQYISDGITTIDAGDFYNISYANNTLIKGLDKKIEEHNTSSLAHQDLRTLISNLTSRVTQNESDIATNTGNIQQNTLAIGNLRTQVEANASLIADTRNNLANNYYTKSQTYTKDEVKSLLGTAAGFQFVIVDELPEQGDPTKIYLVPITQPETRAAVAENSYFEYIWLSEENRYENIGSTQIDLSNYYTKDEITNLLSPIQEDISTLETDNTTNKANISSLQSNKLDKNQGQGNSGKILGIDSNGNVVPQEVTGGVNLKYSSFVQPDSFMPNTDLWAPTTDSNSLGIGYIDMNVKINFIGLTNGNPTIMNQTVTDDGNGYSLQAINLGTGTNHDTIQIMSSTNLISGQEILISPEAFTVNGSNILTENNGLLKNQGIENSGKVLTVGSDGNVAPQAAQGGVNLKYSSFVQNEQMPNADLWTPTNPSSDSVGIGYFQMSEAGQPEKLSITGLQGGLPLMSYGEVADGIQQQIAFGISTNTGTKGISITTNDSMHNRDILIAPDGITINGDNAFYVKTKEFSNISDFINFINSNKGKKIKFKIEGSSSEPIDPISCSGVKITNTSTGTEVVQDTSLLPLAVSEFYAVDNQSNAQSFCNEYTFNNNKYVYLLSIQGNTFLGFYSYERVTSSSYIQEKGYGTKDMSSVNIAKAVIYYFE